jgi:hypothetical protein
VSRWLAGSLGIRVPQLAHEKLPQDQHQLLPPAD